MEARLCCFLLALQIVVRFVPCTSRPFASNDGVGVNQPGQSPESLQVLLGSKFGFQMESKQGIKGKEEIVGATDEAYSKGLSKIGSSPPSCEHKCYGCTPCEAIQVPTTSKAHSHLVVNYANYEPEGWKCKCGPTFYSP
ncbi:polygalacturonase isoform X2 [Ricinus communis]|uniref:polygalacturonase isoform X2 n=1 Tax=Ricinus communis TaxID=3988 RepID=UPI000772132D|nr:polygalacturonase isoform X2 [Ricinus communis]|eukprot:XP_025013505.1 polygalacturonase isoform X2 [Ricinus communis]